MIDRWNHQVNRCFYHRFTSSIWTMFHSLFHSLFHVPKQWVHPRGWKQLHADIICDISGWWCIVVYLPLWKIMEWTSVGIIPSYSQYMEKMFQTTKQIYYIIDITWYNTKMGSAPVRSFPDFGVNELIRAVLAPTCADQFCLTTQGWPVPVPALPFLVKLLAALRWSRPFWSLTLEHLHYIMAERTCLGAPKNMFKQWWQKISI